jgi:hypothetical protein
VDPTALDRAPRRHQGLGRDLAAKGTLALLCGVLSSEDVDLDGLDVKKIHKEL